VTCTTVAAVSFAATGFPYLHAATVAPFAAKFGGEYPVSGGQTVAVEGETNEAVR
jgi:uncharacterized protein (DUF1330 family)